MFVWTWHTPYTKFQLLSPADSKVDWCLVRKVPANYFSPPKSFVYLEPALCHTTKPYPSPVLILAYFYKQDRGALVKQSLNRSGDFRVTHQAIANNRWSLLSRMVSFCSTHFVLILLRTDTMCENNDHLLFHVLVGQ